MPDDLQAAAVRQPQVRQQHVQACARNVQPGPGVRHGAHTARQGQAVTVTHAAGEEVAHFRVILHDQHTPHPVFPCFFAKCRRFLPLSMHGARRAAKPANPMAVGTSGMAITHLLYLHGFRSSPQSAKAQKMAARVRDRHPQVNWWCPQLPPSPRLAIQLVMHGISRWPRDAMAVVGSSLGGFYATYVAEASGCRAVLLNPTIDPARDLAPYTGEHAAWHNPNEHFVFEPRFVDELRSLEC